MNRGGSPSHDVQLDIHNQCLLRGSRELPLRPKTFGVLHYLVQQAGQLVTKTQLLDAVWSDSCVGDAVLKVSIRELRQALDDDPKTGGALSAPRLLRENTSRRASGGLRHR